MKNLNKLGVKCMKSPLALYSVLGLALFNIFIFINNKDNESIFLFLVISAIVRMKTTNMILVLLIPLIFVNLLIFLRKLFVTREGETNEYEYEDEDEDEEEEEEEEEEDEDDDEEEDEEEEDDPDDTYDMSETTEEAALAEMVDAYKGNSAKDLTDALESVNNNFPKGVPVAGDPPTISVEAAKAKLADMMSKKL